MLNWIIRNATVVLTVLLLTAFAATTALAEPYPRHDHHGLSENKRQNPHYRTDTYGDYSHYRTDQYKNTHRPNLSTLEHSPEGKVSFERVKTKRSTYKDRSETEVNARFGQGYYDKRDNKGVDVLEGGKGYY